MKCLLIETKDNRQFFTYEKNFNQLIEFSKHFKAKISLVNMSGGEVLDLEELAPALCDSRNKKQKVDYKIIETKLNFQKNKTIKNSHKIQTLIKKRFLLRESVSLKFLKTKYKKLNLSDAAFCNYMKKVKEEMQKEGYKIVKLKAGEYKLS